MARFEDEMIKKSPIRRMAKRLCLSSEDMTLIEAAVRDEYREMGIEEAQTALPATHEAQRSLSAAGSNGHGNRPANPAIREPQRKADVHQKSGQTTGPPLSGDASPKQLSAGSGTNGAAPPNGVESKQITLRGVIGPIEADASGKTIRRNGNGVEYVVFKIAHNGSATTVYSKRPELLSEIAHRQGQEATARLAIVSDQSRGYHVLQGFTEG